MSDVYFLFSGNVRISIDEADGETAFFFYRIPGEMVGFFSVLTGEAQPLKAVAAEDVRAGRMRGADFREMVLSHRALCEYMLRRVTLQLCAETNHIRRLVLMKAPRRVASELLDRMARHGNVFEIPGRIEMASRLGMRSETLVRQLTDLQKRGLIALDGRKVKILDAKQLSDLVE